MAYSLAEFLVRDPVCSKLVQFGPEEFQNLPEERQQDLEKRNAALQERVNDTLRQVRQVQKEAAERVRQLDRDVALFTVGPHLDELRETYAALPEVLAFLDQVQHDLPEHLDDFRRADSDSEGESAQALESLVPGRQREEHLAR